MKRIRRVRDRIVLHPIMSFLILILVTVVLSGILNLFNVSTTYNKVTANGSYENVLVSVESLFNLSGIKYIFSNAVSNFSSFMPLSMFLITLIGIGIMDKSGFLDSFFYILTKKMSKRTVTFSLSLICIIASIMGDISFIILIPLAALLFKYGKRNPRAGIICAFASLSCGVGINIFMNAIDSTLLGYTTMVANMITADYVINTTSNMLIMSVAAISLALIITSITEKITVPDIGTYQMEDEEEDYLTKREKKGLIISCFCGIIYALIFIYNIIPNIPFGGNLLDYSQILYIDKLFGYNSFFNQGFVFVVTLLFIILGLSYGIVNKTIKNHRDLCAGLSHSLDGVGKVLVLIFMASMFIFIFKKTNIGPVIVASFANLIANSSFTGIPLILLVLFISALSALLVPGSANKWVILSGVLVPVFMNSGMSPEFATVVFRAGECITYGLTPLMAYFIIYIAFMELYSQGETDSITSNIKYIIPYSKYTTLLWIVILIAFYIINLPLGINAFPTI
ncbi:MAG: AbgT family transporter [Bacilli bacterium]|nr:AbgT family transporter [Bacilli bacterium]MDD3895534.1 AbgT family transporter [Bacilli bacterium]MDD4407524.1 AbgT family transporter [Bacilli bacterium]